MKPQPAELVRFAPVGDWILYQNRYNQIFNAKVLRKPLLDDGRLFLIVRRDDQRMEECLAYSDFENGEYTYLT